MKVTNIRSDVVKTYTVDIEDGEIRPQPYVQTGRQYRVKRITVVKRDGNVSSVELRGAVLKTDGAEGLNPARESFHGQGNNWPEWLHGLVGGLA